MSSKYIFGNGFVGEKVEDSVLRKVWSFSKQIEESAAEMMVCVTLEVQKFFYVEDIEAMMRIVKNQYPEAGTLKKYEINLFRFEGAACEVSGISLTFNLIGLRDEYLDGCGVCFTLPTPSQDIDNGISYKVNSLNLYYNSIFVIHNIYQYKISYLLRVVRNRSMLLTSIQRCINVKTTSCANRAYLCPKTF